MQVGVEKKRWNWGLRIVNKIKIDQCLDFNYTIWIVHWASMVKFGGGMIVELIL